MDGLLDAIERAGGYAALTALIILGVLWIGKGVLDNQAKRAAAREAQAKADSDNHLAEIKADFETQLQHERVTQDFIARMNDRYDTTLNRVTEAFGENSAIIRQAKEEIRRNAAALDRNTAMLEKFVPTLTKKSAGRKPQVGNE